MNLRLVSITQPVLEGVSTPAELLAWHARISNTANQMNHATGPKLMRSLVKRQEWSPFDMIDLTFEVTTTRDVGRQMIRHWSFRFQEFSQRYAEVPMPPVMEMLRLARAPHPTDRQQSVYINNPAIEDWWNRTQASQIAHSWSLYEAALGMGIAKELARTLLPEGLTPTTLHMKGSLRSWMFYCALRQGNGTQLEHQAVAEACWAIVLEHFPVLEGIEL
jgi:thymidylate synthase (FAD)